jgi:hypothetical protein
MSYSKEEKAMWLEDWRQSGKTPWAYAKENGLVPQTFNSWTKPRKATKQVFVEVPRQTLQTACLVPEILIEKDGIKIHVPLEAVVKEIKGVIADFGRRYDP